MAKNRALEKAITQAGGITRFAESVGETPQTANNWRLRGAVPANKCQAVSRLTGLPLKRLRPGDWQAFWPSTDAGAA